MKRTKAKRTGSGGRLRLGLLLACAAAFLLVPAAMASATATEPGEVEIEISGEGSGEIVGLSPLPGSPSVACHWNGVTEELTGTCVSETEFESALGFYGIKIGHVADSGSEFAYPPGGPGWAFSGTLFNFGGGCETEDVFCALTDVAGSGSQVGFATIEVEFECEGAAPCPPPEPGEPLNLTTSGTAGSITCLADGSPCGEKVEEGETVELSAEPGAESDFAEWTTGPCAGESTNPCSFTMPATEVSANAHFVTATYTFSVTEAGGGEGSVECEVNAGGLGACPTEATHGDVIKVVATPEAENIVESLAGGGSAAGSCSIAGEGESGECEFTIEANSSVNVVFEEAGTKATTPATIEGEVPVTTSLEGCGSPVVLGPFEPAEVANYLGDCGLTVTSTGNETELSASDPDETATKGHLVQGSYSLPSALQTRATGLGGLEFPGTGSGFAPLSSDVTLLEYGGPVSADEVTVFFRQHIGLHDALHTGTYSKTITLTLEQTA